MHAARLGAFDVDTQRGALAHQSEGVQRPAILPQAVNIEAVEAGERLGAIHSISAQRVRGQAVNGELKCCGHGSLLGLVSLIRYLKSVKLKMFYYALADPEIKFYNPFDVDLFRINSDLFRGACQNVRFRSTYLGTSPHRVIQVEF